MTVARYTACGEYDNQTRFSLPVLQGYVDEILEGYLRRIIYSVQDGTRSLVLWRGQVSICGVSVPLYSFFAFCMGVLIVEKPTFIPAVLSFSLAMLLLEQMQERLSSPSPWRRCFSFVHYFHVLIRGNSGDPKQTTISAYEGAEDWEIQQKALQERIIQDKKFLAKKEAAEKQIERIESFKVQTDSQPIPMEILMVLGKVQGIVGGKSLMTQHMRRKLSFGSSLYFGWACVIA